LNEQKHIINRQVLELTIPERGRAQFIQNKISEIVRYKLNPALDAAFSKLAKSDEIIRIDKLVIDLDTIAESNLENEFVERTVKEISNKIGVLIKSGVKAEKQTPVNGKSLDIGAGFTFTTKSKDVLDQFVYFLQFGHFPWWHVPSGKKPIPETDNLDEIFSEILKYDKTKLKNALLTVLRKNAVRQRLMFQFNYSQLDSLLSKINDKLFENYSDLLKTLLSFVGSAELAKHLNESFYEIALEYFSVERELVTDDQKIGFVKDIFKNVLSNKDFNEKEKILLEILKTAQLKKQFLLHSETLLILAAVVRAATEELSSASLSLKEVILNIPERNEPVIKSLIDSFNLKTEKVITKTAIDENEEIKKGIEKSTAEKEMETKAEDGDKTISKKDKIGVGGKTDSTDVKPEKSNNSFSLFPPQPMAGVDEISVLNAGLVLIHPFLRYFFEGLNLLDKELLFKSKFEAFKAVHLLQYIVTGNETTPESDLPLNKILCGIDITEPVPKNVGITEEEKQECLFLIKTVLERWEALKTTNPAALRETFLQREGILKKAGQSWNLTIERNTFDIMLEKLPWSISLIKLPWCEQILYVEW
jgi:hypothetical protein